MGRPLPASLLLMACLAASRPAGPAAAQVHGPTGAERLVALKGRREIIRTALGRLTNIARIQSLSGREDLADQSLARAEELAAELEDLDQQIRALEAQAPPRGPP